MTQSQKAARVPDAQACEEDKLMYGQGPVSLEELDAKYPNRPRNHSQTLAFHELYTSLFDPLIDNKKKPTGPSISRAKRGPHGTSNLSPHEIRRSIIETFMSRWRKEVGNDFYPALRLIIPEKDRDRAMYGLKEKAIGKLLVKLMRIDKDSEDGYNLLNWKLPGQTTASRMAGDFAGRCYEVISKRPMRSTPGTMGISEVNELLDKLSAAQKEEQQLPIFEIFYKRMNAHELMWLIRIILRQMKVGATEKTFLDIFHPDGDTLFNVSSSLRRVCWELYDPTIRLEGDEAGITLMQCFQPQLAQFQMHSLQKMVDLMRPTEEDNEFWIEEKLDGERMQLHMMEDDNIPGGKRFGFWSRKAKDYTYLYGNGFQDENSALTRHIATAFDSGVRNIILDGEMITWDPESDCIVPFGTLKTAALSEQRNPFSTGQRPLFRVFDILFLNDQPLTRYTLRDRRKALERSITDIHRRMEIHTYDSAHSADAIEPLLRKVVAEASEGLVLKNPRSIYRLNSRNDDWMKVKPEYMTEFGESLDCVIIGGYYGSGHRGGRLSSFLCGLRVDKNQIQKGANPMKCFSFFKVGGGLRAEDYANIRHHTEGKWIDWDSKNPPVEYIELGGGQLQYERPDVWIRPCDSLVVSVKAASVGNSDQFRTGFTLRFPRFKRLRMDRSWETALSIQEFIDLKNRVYEESKDKEFKVDTRRKATKRLKKENIIAGNENTIKTPYAGPVTQVFDGLNFCIMSPSTKPIVRTKAELEQIIKANGGKAFQSPTAASDMVCVADKRLVKVASLVKAGQTNIVKPTWIFDCIKTAEEDQSRPRYLLPFEPMHLFHITEAFQDIAESSVDQFRDSYARGVSPEELKQILDKMPKPEETSSDEDLVQRLQDLDVSSRDTRGRLFRGCRVLLWSKYELTGKLPTEYDTEQLSVKLAGNLIQFGSGTLASDLNDDTITHVVLDIHAGDLPHLKFLRQKISRKKRLPRLVTTQWVEQSWDEMTLLDEERYAPVG